MGTEGMGLPSNYAAARRAQKICVHLAHTIVYNNGRSMKPSNARRF
jgi:hypothetical protein